MDADFKRPKYAGHLYQQVGLIFQNSDIQLFNTTVAEELAFGPRQLGLLRRRNQQRVNDTLELLEIEHLRERILSPFWRGKKIVAIASVLTMNQAYYCLMSHLTASHRNTNASSRNYYKS